MEKNSEPLDYLSTLYRTNITLSAYLNLLGDVQIQITPYHHISAFHFLLGFYQLKDRARDYGLKYEDCQEGYYPVFQNFTSDVWNAPYLVNGVNMSDEELAHIYETMDWNKIEPIKTSAYIQAKGDEIVVVDPLEIEYLKVELNQYGNSGGVLAKIFRVIGSLSDEIFETGTGYGIFSRTLLAGRPKQFITSDIKYWFDAPAKLSKICAASDIKFEFHNKRSIDVQLDNSVDTVFFDSDHSFDYLTKEMEMFVPLAKKFLIFHDVNCEPVKLAINKYMDLNGDKWKHLYFTTQAEGLLILAKNDLFNQYG